MDDLKESTPEDEKKTTKKLTLDPESKGYISNINWKKAQNHTLLERLKSKDVTVKSKYGARLFDKAGSKQT